jgi:hypothetical protein
MLLIGAALGDVGSLLTAIFTGGLVIVAIVAALFAWGQLQSSRQIAADERAADLEREKRGRVYALVDRTTHLDFVQLNAHAVALFQLDSDLRRTVWWEDPDRKAIRDSAITLLNFCEEIAGEYLDGLLDREVADSNVAYIAASVWLGARDFVTWFRNRTGEQLAWDRLREFAEQWPVP